MIQGFGMNTRGDQQNESVCRSGFLHAGISGYFRTLEDGERIFYPQGVFGRRGFAVASTDQELILRTNIRGFHRISNGIVIVLILAFSGFLSTWTSWPLLLIVIGSLPGLWLLARAYFRRFTRTMDPVAIPNSPMACWRSMGETINPMLLIGQTVFICALSGASLYRAYQSHDPILWLLGVIVATATAPYVIALLSWQRTWMSTK